MLRNRILLKRYNKDKQSFLNAAHIHPKSIGQSNDNEFWENILLPIQLLIQNKQVVLS